ncbi:histidine kinase [Ensifer adhaerens]|uniref:sensor histidine kinase n=1 Tax=Ensifer adhaerens TaxID=106592 RepID=UPI0023A96095|nr:histidine kinase [Ensifer adhaerens]WDZ78823.1 histidine kinase [Ensifer adhaerens]
MTVLGSFYRNTFDMDHSDTSAAEFFSRVVKLVLGFWAVEFFITGSLWVMLGVNPIDYAPIKLVVSLVSVVITLVISHIVAMMRARNIAAQVFVAAVLSILASTAATTVDYQLFTYVKPSVGVEYTIENFCYTLFYGVSLFFGWSCFFIAYMYNLKVRAQERRLAISREEALAAKMQALYYQINPHFLFNTLNSIVGLIEEGASSQASRVVISLSSFLRKTLEMDPLRDLALSEELALQSEYLAIEKERFSDRISVTLDVPEELRAALVPSLILQPLIENAVKHGLGRSSGDLKITISASQEENRLQLSVDNVSAAGETFPGSSRPGLGVGLANVEQRVRARFPEGGSLVAGQVSEAHFRATLTMPLRTPVAGRLADAASDALEGLRA